MKQKIYLIGKAGLASAMAMAITGCVTRTVYVTTPLPPSQPTTEVVATPPPPPPPPLAPAEPAVVVIQAETDFYEPLTPYGQWVVVASYGRCWRPARVDAGWRPYSNGHWERTEAGWFWASDEPWAWATYHYGRWDWTPAYGWIWVPQTQWAPAWVTWREGGGYIGWAPLPPAARIMGNGSVEVHETLIAPRFVFVEQRRLMEPVRPKTVIVNNTTVINQTVNITKIKVVNKTVINEGPRIEVIERASGHRLQAHPVNELRRKEEAPVAARKRNPLFDDKKAEAPAHRDAEPAKRPARDLRPPERPVETPRPARPAVVGEKAREIDGQKPLVVQPARPEPARPPRRERTPDVLPVVAKPAVNVEPAPAVAPRETERVEKPASPAPANTTEATPAPAVNKARENRPVEKKSRNENDLLDAFKKPAPERGGAQNASQVRSPKDKPAPAEPAAALQKESKGQKEQKDQKEQKEKKNKKSEDEAAKPQVPVTPLPAQ